MQQLYMYNEQSYRENTHVDWSLVFIPEWYAGFALVIVINVAYFSHPTHANLCILGILLSPVLS